MLFGHVSLQPLCATADKLALSALVLEVVDEVPGEGDLLAGDEVTVLAVLGVSLQVLLQVGPVGRPEPAVLAVVPPLVGVVDVLQIVGRGVGPGLEISLKKFLIISFNFALLMILNLMPNFCEI